MQSRRGTEKLDRGYNQLFVSTRRQVGAEYLVLDSVAQFHACPINYLRQKKYRCLILESTQQVEFDSNMTEDDG